ncbi:MAG: beta-lactamase family protein [Lachnospiraceae bacterium]|nr:beta-lactamase family protein [Lachnospiraceae bacterium]
MDLEKISRYLDSLVKDENIPSVDCIIRRNHEILFRRMCGYTDKAGKIPVKENQLYLMFSMTKVQTMVAFMQLVEQKKVSLEDEVSKYLPAYDNLLVKQRSGNAINITKCDVPIKLKHLVSMQSGLDYNTERPGILRVLEEKGREATTREIVDSFVESPLEFVPGEHFRYSLSHDVIAAVIEVVSGKKFSEYLKENIWDRLGMNNTFFAKPQNYIPNLACQFIVNDKGIIEPMDSSCNYQFSDNYESGGAGLISTCDDYSLFADTIACGGTNEFGKRIIKPDTIDIMKKNLLGEESLKDIAETMGRKGYGYGTGVQVLMNPEEIGSKAPKGIFGWDGAAGSCIIMDTQNKLSLVFAMHVRNCGKAYSQFHPKLRDLMYE